MPLPEKIADLTILPLLYKKSTLHALYLKEHVTKLRGEKSVPLPNGRTLFVVNIPPDTTERELTLFFNTCGTVERVVINQDAQLFEAYEPIEDSDDEDADGHGGVGEEEAGSDGSAHRRKKRKLSKKEKDPPPRVVPLPQPEPSLRTFHHTGSSAHIIFTDPSSLSRALSLPATSSSQRPWPPTTAAIAPSGLAHYLALHEAQRPALAAAKAYADSFLEVFDYNKVLSKQKSQYRKGEAVVDEDGFTLVTRGGAYGTTLGGGVGVASRRFMKGVEEGQEAKSGKRGKKKNKKPEKDGFYKFQRHELKLKGMCAGFPRVFSWTDGLFHRAGGSEGGFRERQGENRSVAGIAAVQALLIMTRFFPPSRLGMPNLQMFLGSSVSEALKTSSPLRCAWSIHTSCVDVVSCHLTLLTLPIFLRSHRVCSNQCH